MTLLRTVANRSTKQRHPNEAIQKMIRFPSVALVASRFNFKEQNPHLNPQTVLKDPLAVGEGFESFETVPEVAWLLPAVSAGSLS